MSSNYGSYTTIDAPVKNIDQAYEWLSNEFESIGSFVWQKSNPHDFGEYPSFEVNYPMRIKEAMEWLDLYDDDDDDLEQWGLKDKLVEAWQVKADDIEARFNKLYHSN